MRTFNTLLVGNINMKKYEYDLRTKRFKHFTELLDAFNVVGELGWEVVQWKELDLGGSIFDHDVLITLRREKVSDK